MSDLVAFIYAVLSQWIALMAGIVSLTITLVLRLRGKEPNNKIFWSVAVFCFLLAFFLAWQREHTSLMKVEKELAQAQDQNAPRLSGQIEQVIADKEAGGGAQIFLQISIRNVGAPSIAEKFALHIKSGDVEYHDAPTPLPDEYASIPVGKSTKVTFRRQDAIDVKTLKPVERGGLERGWLRFIVLDNELDFIRQPGMKYTVSFADVAGTSHAVDYVIPERVK
jgi:hypothetical protein